MVLSAPLVCCPYARRAAGDTNAGYKRQRAEKPCVVWLVVYKWLESGWWDAGAVNRNRL